jgi:outer membrane protein assembly factor BamB
MKRLAAAFVACLMMASTAHAQRDWMTDNGDAQRSAWVRSDAKINPDSMAKPGFQFLWKMKLNNPPRQLNALTPPATLERLIGYRGFRMLGFVAGSSGRLFTIDTDLGRMEWEKQLPGTAAPGASTLNCPGGITTGVARPVLASIAPPPSGFGAGRQTPAKGAVGEPGQGAVTLANVRPPGNFNSGAMMPQATRVNPANPPGGQFGAGPFLVYALAGDGKLHTMHLSNGADFEPPTSFVPASANASGLIIVNQVAYVVTTNSCGGAANGVWALDLITKAVKTFKANVAGSAGVGFGDDGTIYVATGSGSDHPNSLVALDPKTLAVKASFSAGAQEFSSSPVIFAHKGKVMIAATTKDGRVHVFDSANLNAPLASSSVIKGGQSTPGALASWQDRDGTRWILTPTNSAVVTWKLTEQQGGVSLQEGWARDLESPLSPTIINGVVFLTASGEFRTDDNKITAAQRVARSGKAVIYALNGTTGKELWSSGTTITSFARGGALSGGMGQIYLTTHDGTIYAFGFPMEH